jgi:hypothetical protein
MQSNEDYIGANAFERRYADVDHYLGLLITMRGLAESATQKRFKPALLLVNEKRVPRVAQAPAKCRPEKPELVGAQAKVDDQQQNIHG